MDEYDHWPRCETCSRTFQSRSACHKHMSNVDHWAPRFECETCTREFRSQNAANQHMSSLGHWAPKIPCETCSKKFHTQSAADKHMKDLGHYRNYCRECKRGFMSENDLKTHLNSKIHRGSNIPCPFCKKNFTTASGLTHHLETASCRQAPGLNRETILQIVRQRDPHGVITRKQIGWDQEDNSIYTATDMAFNGSHWECYICHKQFSGPRGLNQHLNSPAHKQKVYHCPNRRRSCEKQFITLAALFNHLESESCSFMRFEKVQQQVNNVFNGRGLIGFA